MIALRASRGLTTFSFGAVCDPGQVNPECATCGGGGFAAHAGRVLLSVDGEIVGSALARVDWPRYESTDTFTGCFIWADGRRWAMPDEWNDQCVAVLTDVERAIAPATASEQQAEG